MSIPRPPQKVKLVMSFLYREETDFGVAARAVEEKYGPIDLVSEPLAFAFTNYYEPEMGQNLQRRVVGLAPLISPEEIVAIKLWTNEIEKQLVNERGGRKVNIDPGYIAAAKFVLATGKDYSHRIYLGQGIYGDLTLIFKKGSFQPLSWTYPDYGSPPLLNLINLLRRKYLWQLKNMAANLEREERSGDD